MRFSARFVFLITASRDQTSLIINPRTMEILRTFNASRPLNACVINPRFLEDSKNYLKYAIVAGG
jgi:hypothetical protein